jgi:hypothetical protein
MAKGILVWTKPGSVHLWSDKRDDKVHWEGVRVLRLERVGNWAGANGIGPAVGEHCVFLKISKTDRGRNHTAFIGPALGHAIIPHMPPDYPRLHRSLSRTDGAIPRAIPVSSGCVVGGRASSVSRKQAQIDEAGARTGCHGVHAGFRSSRRLGRRLLLGFRVSSPPSERSAFQFG